MPVDTDKVLREALHGGIPGMIAMAIQVTSLMWLRTTTNFQYARGGSMSDAMRMLYAQGGVGRFYRGYVPALIQGPLSRFGDTFANAGMLAALEGADMPLVVKTTCASVAAACFRILLMPIDTVKTSMQVNGDAGLRVLMQKVRASGPSALFHGSVAASVATFVGHAPWYTTYNYMNLWIPVPDTNIEKMVRNAGIGFSASMISDSVSNSVRVIKTMRQTSPTHMGYRAAIQLVLAKDGVLGLLGRGLKTKILTNGIQGLMFSVLWGIGKEKMKEREA